MGMFFFMKCVFTPCTLNARGNLVYIRLDYGYTLLVGIMAGHVYIHSTPIPLLPLGPLINLIPPLIPQTQPDPSVALEEMPSRLTSGGGDERVWKNKPVNRSLFRSRQRVSAAGGGTRIHSCRSCLPRVLV